MTELNERQKNICEDLGLPTAIEKLSLPQQRKLERIDSLLSYLDEKYNDTFIYVGYYEAFLEKERLDAYPSSFNEYECVVLTVGDDGKLYDNYPFLFVRRAVRESLLAYLREETDYMFKAYVVNGETMLTDTVDVDMGKVDGNAWVSFTVYVNGKKSPEEASTIGEAIAGWYKKHCLYGSTNVISIKEEDFQQVSLENYRTVKRKYGVKNLVVCDVNKDGLVNIC